jgi:hypothetical protein
MACYLMLREGNSSAETANTAACNQNRQIPPPAGNHELTQSLCHAPVILLI